MSKQTSAVAQPVLTSETDFCHLLQPSFSLYHFYGLLKFAEIPKRREWRRVSLSRTCFPCRLPSTFGLCLNFSSQIPKSLVTCWSFVAHHWWQQGCSSAELGGVKHRVLCWTTSWRSGKAQGTTLSLSASSNFLCVFSYICTTQQGIAASFRAAIEMWPWYTHSFILQEWRVVDIAINKLHHQLQHQLAMNQTPRLSRAPLTFPTACVSQWGRQWDPVRETKSLKAVQWLLCHRMLGMMGVKGMICKYSNFSPVVTTCHMWIQPLCTVKSCAVWGGACIES